MGTAGRSKLTLCVLTTGRQDWGILRSCAKLLSQCAWVDLRLVAGGMACAAEFGNVTRYIASEGFQLSERLDWLSDGVISGTPLEASRALASVGTALERQRPDAILLVGDRYETLAAASAATMLRVPIIHLHGGEETEGAFDNAIRHAITKLSHLHLTSHPNYARAVVQMGEDPSTVHVVGAPGLDNLYRSDLATHGELEELFAIPLTSPVVVVTVQPTTLGRGCYDEVEAVCYAMSQVAATYVVTLPNSDPGHLEIRERLDLLKTRTNVVVVDALGERRYWGLLRIADAVLGNSSSGVIEAPVLGVPTVNVGNRQTGRLRAASILDVPPEGEAVSAALRTALSSAFRSRFSRAPNPPDPTPAASKIARVLANWQPPNPPVKPLLKLP